MTTGRINQVVVVTYVWYFRRRTLTDCNRFATHWQIATYLFGPSGSPSLSAGATVVNLEVLARLGAVPPFFVLDDGSVRLQLGILAVVHGSPLNGSPLSSKCSEKRELLASYPAAVLLARWRPVIMFDRSPSNVRLKRRRIHRTCPARLIAEGATNCLPLGAYTDGKSRHSAASRDEVRQRVRT